MKKVSNQAKKEVSKSSNNEAFAQTIVKLGTASVLTKGTGKMGAELFGKWGK